MQHDFLEKSLRYASEHYDTFAILTSNQHKDEFGNFEVMIALGCKSSLYTLDEVSTLLDSNKTYIGYLSYTLCKALRGIPQENPRPLPFPDLYFFEPEQFIALKTNGEWIGDTDILNSIEQFEYKEETQAQEIVLEPFISKSQYIQNVQSIIQDIEEGQYYELNYCVKQGFKGKINPIQTFLELNSLSSFPFAGMLKMKDQYILSASPERFIQKNGNTLRIQPIKGTAARNSNTTIDLEGYEHLNTSIKERAENVMIVDLSRNDLNRICETGSVVPEYLFKIESFKTVYQMISSIKGQLKSGISFKEILKACFPMGSMTGAPKIEVMKAIDSYEDFARLGYSGSLGYIHQGNMDFNVLIRSIYYDKASAQGYYAVGSAITYLSEPEQEYQECILKSESMRQCLLKRMD
jgi:para-aminobenzoate synthetase component I